MTPEQITIQSLEQRVATLERMLERAMTFRGTMVEFNVPVYARREIIFNKATVISNDGAANITSGNSAPGSAPIGSLFLKLNGTVNNTLFVMESGGWSSTA